MLAIKKFQVGHSKNVAIPHRAFQALGDPEESRLKCQTWEPLLFHLLGIIVWESGILTAVEGVAFRVTGKLRGLHFLLGKSQKILLRNFLLSTALAVAHQFLLGFPGGLYSKESACNAGDLGLTPGWGPSPGEGNGSPLQYSCLKNSMDRGTLQALVHGIAESQTWLSD